MKDIFAIQNPETSKIVALSMRRYGLIPLSVQKNEKYWEWVSDLKNEGLDPMFKIIDKVKEDDAEMIFEMYLGLFKSWNIHLFNDNTAINTLGIFNYLNNPALEKYLLNDIGRMHSCLDLFLRFISTKSIHINERTLCNELVLFCWLKSHYSSFREEKLLTAKEFESFFNKTQDCPSFINDCYGSLISRHRIKNCMDEPFFAESKNLSEDQILNGINYIFLKCQLRLIFSKAIWDNLFDIYSFLKNPKVLMHRYEIGVLYCNLQLDIDNQLDLNEYNELSSNIPKGKTIFSHLAYTHLLN